MPKTTLRQKEEEQQKHLDRELAIALPQLLSRGLSSQLTLPCTSLQPKCVAVEASEL